MFDNMWGVVFILGAIVALLVLAHWLTNVWKRYWRDLLVAEEKKAQFPSWLKPTLLTVISLGIYCIALPIGWQAMVSLTTTRSDYQTPAQIQEQKNTLGSNVPTDEELDQVREKQKQRQQADPHKKALSAFDEAMEAEAKKIKERSLSK